MRAEVVEQVFVRPRGGRFEVLLVLEAASGARTRVTVQAPEGDAEAAMRFLARYLQREGIALAPRWRVRRERGATLRDDPVLRRTLQAAMAAGTGDDEA